MAKFTPNTKEELKALVEDENIYLGDINTSNITDMSYLFKRTKRNDFSGIEKWDVSKVKTMKGMFWGCETFNQNISKWNTSSVVDMSCMFEFCYSFNQPLNDWDVSRVRDMKGMFECCTSFNQDISGWDMSGVEKIYRIFEDCENLKQSYMFRRKNKTSKKEIS